LIRAARSGDIKRVQALLLLVVLTRIPAITMAPQPLMFAALVGYTEIVRPASARLCRYEHAAKIIWRYCSMLAANHQVGIVKTSEAGAQVNAKNDILQ